MRLSLGLSNLPPALLPDLPPIFHQLPSSVCKRRVVLLQILLFQPIHGSAHLGPLEQCSIHRLLCEVGEQVGRYTCRWVSLQQGLSLLEAAW